MVPQLTRGLESKKLSKNNMYPGLRPEHLYLFFTCSNKKFLGKTVNNVHDQPKWPTYFF